MLKTAILGPVYTPDDPHHVAYLQDALVEINQTGKIITVLTPNDADYQGHSISRSTNGSTITPSPWRLSTKTLSLSKRFTTTWSTPF